MNCNWAVKANMIIENRMVIPTVLYQAGSKSLNIPVKRGKLLFQFLTNSIFVFETKITIPYYKTLKYNKLTVLIKEARKTLAITDFISSVKVLFLSNTVIFVKSIIITAFKSGIMIDTPPANPV